MAPAGDYLAAISSARTSAIAAIMAEKLGVRRKSILVVGCGSGKEAAVLASDLESRVIGIDIAADFDPGAARLVKLQRGDATALEFQDQSFDVVYSYHALEHIPHYHRALSEMKRVLRSGGVFCIGTPNRARIVGYIGGGSTFREKISWNLADWNARLKGRFRNECGAHAGYTASELRAILLAHFSSVADVTLDYYLRLYEKQQGAVKVLSAAGIGKVLFPSVYFVGGR